MFRIILNNETSITDNFNYAVESLSKKARVYVEKFEIVENTMLTTFGLKYVLKTHDTGEIVAAFVAKEHLERFFKM